MMMMFAFYINLHIFFVVGYTGVASYCIWFSTVLLLDTVLCVSENYIPTVPVKKQTLWVLLDQEIRERIQYIQVQ